MNQLLAQQVVAIFLSCSITPAIAAVINKWVDTDGITHYSDEAPSSPETQVTLIEVPEARLVRTSENENYYSIANQWRRMHEESLERERVRIEEATNKAAQQPAVTNVYINEASEKSYLAAYPKVFYRKHGHHRHHKKFRHSSRYAYRKHLRGNYPIGLHPSRNHYIGGYKHFN